MPDYNRIAAKLAFIDPRSASREEREARIAAALRAADKTGAERMRDSAASLIESFGGPIEYARTIRALPTEPPA